MTATASTRSPKKANAHKAVHNTIGKSTKKSFNSMAHLSLKRFADNDPSLTAGAKRNRAQHPHVAIAELDPSGRAKCKLCGKKITKATLRYGLLLECHKGYRNLCTLHAECFYKHPETQKLTQAKEIHTAPTLSKEQCATIVQKFIDEKNGATPSKQQEEQEEEKNEKK